MHSYLRFSLLPAAIIGPAVAGYGTTYLDLAQAQKAIFPEAGGFTEASVRLTDAQRKAVEDCSGVRQRSADVKVWKVAGGGWFLVDEVLGKHEFITYALGIDAQGGVRGVEIMDYRETYGGQVRDLAWRKQFTGKTVAAPLKLDADIRSISGATLSSRHLTEGVRRLLAIHALVLR